MNRPTKSSIVSVVAQLASRRIARRVITDLQRMRHKLSGDDSELETTWDEICAQVQYEKFTMAWDAYDETVKAIVGGYVGELPAHERDAIWLQTEAGSDWDPEEPETRRPCPPVEDDVTAYITEEHVYAEADRWSNARIRTHIERSAMRD